MTSKAAGRLAAGLASALIGAGLAACGSEEGGPPRLTVFAAASLAPAFEQYAAGFEQAEVQLSFAGSDELAAQIRQGLVPDVYAAANTELPEALAEEGLLAEPVVFAANELVLAVPADSAIERVGDLTEPGVGIGVGDESVPVGSYTNEVLERLGHERARAILDRVETSEPDVSGIVAKLTQGAVDAGFVYASDVLAADGEMRAIELPSRLQPAVAYGIGISSEAEQPTAAKDFVAGLLDGAGPDALAEAGFLPPPATR